MTLVPSSYRHANGMPDQPIHPRIHKPPRLRLPAFPQMLA